MSEEKNQRLKEHQKISLRQKKSQYNSKKNSFLILIVIVIIIQDKIVF